MGFFLRRDEKVPEVLAAASLDPAIGAGASLLPRDLQAQRINLAWLVRLRWGAVLGQLATVLLVDFGMGVELPLSWLLVAIGGEALGNVSCMLLARRERVLPPWALALSMGLDVLLLTGLLFLTGGPFNPFSFLYLVHIALAAVVLPTSLTWGLFALALACYGSLFVQSAWFPLSIQTQLSHADQMRIHMRGMWFAFAVAATFISYFVTRVRQALAMRESELSKVRALAARSESLVSLATLATGAAHELSTPLSTIAIAAKELERCLASPAMSHEDAVADARLIRQEVERCRNILQNMAVDAGQTTGEDFANVPLSVLLESALDGLPSRDRVRVSLGTHSASVLRAHPQATAQALRSIVKNALQASSQPSEVAIDTALEGDVCQIAVRDHGAGMTHDILSRAGEPFFTTKPPGEGMGLGLFLARMLVERSGGRLELRSELGVGTTAIVSMPFAGGSGATATNDRRPS